MRHLSRKIVLVLAEIAIAVIHVAAQAPAQKPSFEVASVRPQVSDDPRFFVRPPARGQFTASGAVAKLLVMLAYDVQDTQVIGGPSWVATEKWNIQAKSDNDQYTVDETRLMLQHLLAERFALQLHRGTKQLPVYVLTVGKGGPRFKASQGTATNIKVSPNSISVQAGTIARLTGVLATQHWAGPFSITRVLLEFTICRFSGMTLPSEMAACPGWRTPKRPVRLPTANEVRFSRPCPISWD